MKNHTTTKSYSVLGRTVTVEGLTNLKTFLPNGDVKISYSNGANALIGKYIHGKPTGKWIRWYENGILASEHNYLNGLLHGNYRQNWDDGKVARHGTYIKGLKEGEVKIYNRFAEVVKSYFYKNNKLTKAKINYGDKKYFEFDAHKKTILWPWKLLFKRYCLLNDSDSWICKTPFEMFDGLKDLVDPEKIAEMLKRLNDRIKEKLGDASDQAVTDCGGGTLVATNEPKADSRTSSRGRNSADKVKDACDAAITSKLGDDYGLVPSMDGVDQATRDAVARMDEQVENCSEDDIPNKHDMIAWHWFWEGTTTENADGSTTVTYEKDDKKTEVVTTQPNGDKKTEYYDSTGTKVIKTEETWHYSKHNGWTEPGDFKGTKTTTDNDDGTKTVVYTDRDGNEATPLQKNSPTPKPRGGTGIPDEDHRGSGMGDCADKRRRWESIRELCEALNWSTRFCKNALLTSSQCLEEVMPDPNGDGFVCPTKNDGKGLTWEELRQRHCEESQKFWISGGSGFDSDYCAPREILEPLQRGLNCSDPVIMCSPIDLVTDETGIQTGFGGEAANNETEPGTERREFRADTNTSFIKPSSGFNAYPNLAPINDMDFDEKIRRNDEELKFVVFASKQCGPCHKVLDVFNQEAAITKSASFHYVDIHQNPSLCQRFDIKYTPTIHVLKNGELVGQRRVGGASRDRLVQYIQRSFNISSTKQLPKQ
jgi:thiol-disulfide isomerase/thioredoxin